MDSVELNYILIALTVLLTGFIVWQVTRLTKQREKERGLLRQTFEGSRGARLITDKNGNLFFANAQMDKLCQPHKGPTLECLDKFFKAHSENSDYLKFESLKIDAAKGIGRSIVLKLKVDDADKWMQIVSQPIANWAGYVHWRLDDVTDSYNMESVIREEREKLLDFTENAPLGFFSLNEKGAFVFANKTLARFLGVELDDLISNSKLHDFFASAPKGAKPYDLIKEGGANQVVEIMMKTSSGKEFNAGIAQTVVNYDEDKVRTRAVVTDLTAERRMRIALKESEDKFDRFFKESPLGITLVDKKGVFKDYNQSFMSLLDVNKKNLSGKKLYDLISKPEKSELEKILSQIKEGDSIEAPIEATLSFNDKEVSTYMYARKFAKDDDQLVLHFIDLTSQKNLEEQFAQSQKMQAVGQLAGGVAHDFNNLLTAMIGYCDLLMLRHKPGDPSFADINQIKQNANRAANLVRQLLAFSRQQTLRPRVLDITDTLTELSHLLRRLIGAQIDLNVEHDADIGLIKVDQGQLEQVLINLAVNARDAIMENMGEESAQGELHIRTFNYQNKRKQKRGADEMPAGDWVAVEVKDTGCGIDRKNMERIFEPFFTTKAVGSGTGLGLATVYGIIRQTGGYIHVDSKIGEGTSFFIYLPEFKEEEGSEEEVEDVKEDIEKQDLTGSASIMLVEDEDAVRTFSVRALTNKGYEVLDADCGESAWEILESQKPHLDLMITDVVMPGMDGPTLVKKVLEERPDLKIIFVSGYTEDKFKDEFGDNVTFMPKPYTLQQLAAKVKEVLGS